MTYPGPQDYPPGPPGPSEPVRPERRRRVSPRQVVGGVFLGLFIAFLAENTGKIRIRIIAPVVTVPLFVALLIAAVFGALATLLLQFRRRRTK